MCAFAFKRPERSSMVMWSLCLLLLVVVVLSVTLRRAEPVFESLPERSFPVQTVTVQPRAVEDVIRIPGRIEAHTISRLAVDKGGRVVEIMTDKGDTVEQGQVLLRLDDRIWRSVLSQAEIERREAEREMRRFTEMARTGAISTSDVDTVRARLDHARVAELEAQVHVEQCTVISPFDGLVNDRYVELGEFAAEGGAVFELLRLDPIKLAFDVPERDISAMKPGHPVEFELVAAGSQRLSGPVSHISKVASLHNNSFRVEVTVPNPSGTLRAGMIASVWIERARSEDAVVIPLSAVIPRKGEHVVFLAREDDRAERRLVKIDRLVGSDVVLASGLEAGDELIVAGHRLLVDGARIERLSGEE